MPEFPPMTRVRRHFAGSRVEHIPAEVRRQLDSSRIHVPAGGRVALAVGSRGIAHLCEIVTAVAEWVRSRDAKPFLVPAMGSHGGATAEGQAAVLAGYGLSKEACGIEVRSRMETVELPRGDAPLPVFLDAEALGADATIVVNRVKPHTSFHGRWESGLVKMLAIGLGKRDQATAIHARGVGGLRDLMPRIARQVLREANVVGGLAVVENARDETMRVEAIEAARIFDREAELLEVARANMPSLPLEEIDVLIVDRMGKDLSGVGMDTNVIGRMMVHGQPEPAGPRIRAIVACDLTPDSHGNATGVGLADVITRRLYEKIDFAATYTNALTTTFLQRAKVPMVAESDREALDCAWRCARVRPDGAPVVLRIRDTLHLEELYASPAAVDALTAREGIDVTDERIEMVDDAGALPAL